MNRSMEAAAPPLSSRRIAGRGRAGYGAASPASRVATRSLRDGLRPPLTREPPRPLTSGSTDRPQPAAPDARPHPAIRKHKNPLRQSLHGFRGLTALPPALAPVPVAAPAPVPMPVPMPGPDCHLSEFRSGGVSSTALSPIRIQERMRVEHRGCQCPPATRHSVPEFGNWGTAELRELGNRGTGELRELGRWGTGEMGN